MAYSDQNHPESPLHLPEPLSPATPPGAVTPASGASAYGPIVPMHPLPPGLAAAPDMKSLLRALKRHWLLASVLGIVAATLAATAVWYFTPVKYTAEIVLKFDVNKLFRNGADDKDTASPFSPQTLLAFAKSRFFIRAAMEQKGVMDLPSIKEQLEPVEWLRRTLQVSWVSPEMLSISLTGTNPHELEMLVDAVANAYVDQLGKAEKQLRGVRIEKLNKIMEKLQLSIAGLKKRYEDTVHAVGALNPNQRMHQSDFDKEMSKELLKQKVIEEQKLARLQTTLQIAKVRREDGTIHIPEVEIQKQLKDKTAYKVQSTEISKLQEELEGMVKVYRDPKHPRLEEQRQKIEKAKKELLAVEKKLLPDVRKELLEYYKLVSVDNVQQIEDEIAMSQALIKLLDSTMDQLEERIKKSVPDSMDLAELLAAFQPEEAVVTRLREQKASLVAENLETKGSAQIQSGDKATAFAEQNIKKQIMMAGGAGGAALGLVLLVIAYWEFRIRRINAAEDVVNGLGWRLVGQLPALPNSARGGLLRRQADPGYWQSLMTESVDATRTMILHAARVDGIRTVMVTSAVSGEGKTSLSCHLACSLARAGRKTLLLDCDLRNPAAHRLFELPGEPGLCEVLRGEVPLAEVIHATPAANLWMIPAGQFDEQALQKLTLSQNGFSPLLDQLKTQFDFIVVDSSPVLPVVDTLVIGQNVDVVVFSLLRDVSRIPSVHAAYQRLATLGIRILGAVVNGVDTGGYGYASPYARQSS